MIGKILLAILTVYLLSIFSSFISTYTSIRRSMATVSSFAYTPLQPTVDIRKAPSRAKAWKEIVV